MFRYDENDGPKEEGWWGERGAHGEDKPPARGISPPMDTWRSNGEDRVPSRDNGDRGGFGERRRDDGDFGRGREDKDFGRGKEREKKQALRNKDISCSVFSQTVLLASIRNAMLVLFLGTLLCYKSIHDDLSVIGEVPVQIRMGNRRKNRIQRKTLKNQAKEVGIN